MSVLSKATMPWVRLARTATWRFTAAMPRVVSCCSAEIGVVDQRTCKIKKVLGGGSMKRRAGLVTQCLIGALLAGAASSGALAADVMPVKAEPMVQTDAIP